MPGGRTGFKSDAWVRSMVVRLCIEMCEKWWLDCALKCVKKVWGPHGG